MNKNNVFSRMWTRLWDAFSKSTQTIQGEMVNSKATEDQPEEIREVIKEVETKMDALEKIATEQEASQAHRKEYDESFSNLTRSLADAAMIIGPEGANIKIILFADSGFIYEVLIKGQLEALEKAFKQLPLEEREKIGKWLQY